MPLCHKCSRELTAESDFGRQDTCPDCGVHTRVCRNCRNYDTTRYNECTEPIAERVVDKEKANFCDHFKPGERTASGQKAREQALKAAEALFRKKD